MLKLMFSKTVAFNLSIYKTPSGEYWGVEQNLHNGKYHVTQYEPKDFLEEPELLVPSDSCDCPNVGEDPYISVFRPVERDFFTMGKEEVRKIFQGD